MFSYFLTPFSVLTIKKFAKKTDNLNILDVGCGNSSATKFKEFFSQSKYWGIDRTNYNNTDEDFNSMFKFILADLENDSLEEVPNQYFDLVVIAHVIEHLRNYDEVLVRIIDKIKGGGYLYIETPSVESVKFPSRLGILNFFDDPTHIKPISIDEIEKIMISRNMKVIIKGKRKSARELFLLPLTLLKDLVTLRTVKGTSLWNLYGFATYVLCKKVDIS